MASSFFRQRNPNMEKALFDWPIVLQYDVKEISRKFFGHEVCLPARSLSQPKPGCVCIRFIHQSNRSISVRLLFLFCSRVFISRSYKNRSIIMPFKSGLFALWSCDTRSLDLCVLFKFIFCTFDTFRPILALFTHFTLHQFLLMSILLMYITTRNIFLNPDDVAFIVARNLIIIFNFSSQRPHLNCIFLSNFYSFDTMEFFIKHEY